MDIKKCACGGIAKLTQYHHLFFVECTKCSNSTAFYHFASGAINIWNASIAELNTAGGK